jgi:hypothetical protein
MNTDNIDLNLFKVRAGPVIREERITGCTVEWLTPRGTDAERCILCSYDGACVACSGKTCWALSDQRCGMVA